MMAASGPLRTFVDGAANDWIEPLADLRFEIFKVRNVLGADTALLPILTRMRYPNLLLRVAALVAVLVAMGGIYGKRENDSVAGVAKFCSWFYQHYIDI